MTARIQGRWRTGRKLGRTLYVGDTLVGLLDDSWTASQVADAMNYAEANGYLVTVDAAPHVGDADTERSKGE